MRAKKRSSPPTPTQSDYDAQPRSAPTRNPKTNDLSPPPRMHPRCKRHTRTPTAHPFPPTPQQATLPP